MLEKNRHTGFTIVELLVVIVVIGILAAITTVVYGGIQDRANDSAVQSNLRQYATKVLEFQAINGRYPDAYDNGSPREGLTKFVLTTGSYATDVHNFYYCVNTTVGSEKFAVGAVSKSGNKFFYGSSGGLKPYTGAWGSSYTHCPGMGVDGYKYSYGYNKDSADWHVWTE